MNNKQKGRTHVPCLRVRQWLPEWDKVHFNDKAHQKRPNPYFYLCSLKASDLKALTGVYRRSTKSGGLRVQDPNVQRGHEEARSGTIREFVKHGYPWCEMGEANRNLPEADELRKPGWLPTAIIVNILPANAQRHKKTIDKADLVSIDEEKGESSSLVLPNGFSSKWQPKSIYPLEVIDGQHRLWAFEGFNPGDDYELPVVMFDGLDHSWQAYLFWSVNITPKRINRSLAFDLYPLLRRETWLDKLAGHSIYRETRCQELVESLWRHPESPWKHRINMLGEKSSELQGATLMVTQAAWIRSLMGTFVKPYENGPNRLGGLFGAPRASNDPVLPWTRSMQAAFLIFCGALLRTAVEKTKAPWAVFLRDAEGNKLFGDEVDAAFYGRYSLLTTDQGIRGILHVFNDVCFVEAASLELSDWTEDDVFGSAKLRKTAATDDDAVTAALESLKDTVAASFLKKIATSLAGYDWRTSSAPGLSDAVRLRQAVFRGSSGYKEIRVQLLKQLETDGGVVGKAAASVLQSVVRD
jgi:hypothetical protein